MGQTNQLRNCGAGEKSLCMFALLLKENTNPFLNVYEEWFIFTKYGHGSV